MPPPTMQPTRCPPTLWSACWAGPTLPLKGSGDDPTWPYGSSTPTAKEPAWRDDWQGVAVTSSTFRSREWQPHAPTADVIVTEAAAAGPDAVIAASGSHAAAAVGYVSGVQVWCAIGTGRALPQQFFEAAASTVAEEPWECDEEIVPLGLFSHVVGPEGVEPASGWQRADCPLAAELLRPAI